MAERNYIELLKSISEKYLPEKSQNNPAAIFTNNNKYGVLHDLKNIKGKNYTELNNTENLNELANDAFEWNKFLLKQRYNIDVEKDVSEGKYSADEAFALTTIYGHKGAVKYLKGEEKLPEKLQATLTEKTSPVKTEVEHARSSYEVKAIEPKIVYKNEISTLNQPEIIMPEMAALPLTKKQNNLLRQQEEEHALNAYKKINSGEVKNIIFKNTLMRTHNLVDEKHSQIHSCFDDAAFFNSRFGFTSHFADPLEDTKHPASEIFNNNFSLAHWGFKNQNNHLQTSGFGSGIVDYSHSHKDFHLDQAFINRAQITIAPEAKEIKISEANLNYHHLFKNNKSIMANYNMAEGMHNFSAHFYSPYKGKHSGFISGVNYNAENISLYAGFNKDHKNISYEISPMLVQSRGRNIEGLPENETNIGVRLSQSVPLKVFSNKQNVGIINSAILMAEKFTNSTGFYINTDFFNLAASFEINKEKGQQTETGVDAHAVYNPFKKVAFYGAYENKKEGDEVEKGHKLGAYLTPIKNLMTNIEFKKEDDQNMFGVGIHKIFNGRNVLSLEAEMNSHNFAPANIKAKLNMALK